MVLVSKRWAIGFIFLLAQQAYASGDDYQLVKYSEVIARGILHAQTKTVKYPYSGSEYPVPFRLEIKQIFKQSVEEPQEIEITDNYWDMCHTFDSLALTKKFQELDGKEVMAFLIRIPPGYDKIDKNMPKMNTEYHLAYSNPIHACAPSPKSLQPYSSSVSQTVQMCMHPTPIPTPNFERAASTANFSFIDTAIHRPDNDMDIGPSRNGTKVKIPQKVQTVLQAEAKADFKGLMGLVGEDLAADAKKPDFVNDSYGENDLPKPQEIYGPVYLIKAPNGLEVYVLMNLTMGYMGGWSYGLVLYDPKTGQVSPKAVWVPGRWLDGLDKDMKMFEGDRSMERPLISFDDINSDSRQALVAEERVHNGTMVNGAVYHYFFIEPDLSLKEVLELEPRLLNYAHTEYWFMRKIMARKKNELTVEATMEGTDGSVLPIGTMVLKSGGGDTPFKSVHKTVKSKKYESLLSPSDDDYFH